MFFTAALQTRMYGCRQRADIEVNMEIALSAIDAVMFTGPMEGPVKLLALPEGALQGFYDEVTDMPHLEYCERLAISVPGPEIAPLIAKAREHKVYIIAQAKTLEPDIITDRFFNTAFIISPTGEVIHKHHKSRVFVAEGSTTPFDVWDAWTERFGTDLARLSPVTDTEIGRIGTLICYEGRFPETARALAVNGAEIIYRTAQAEPWTGMGYFELQNRARALDNCVFVIAPNLGPYHHTLDAPHPEYIGGGRSMIVNYRGQVMSQVGHPESGYAAALLNIEELREYRCESMMGLLPHLAIEQWREIYARPLWPKNLYLDHPPGPREERAQRYREAVRELIDRGLLVPRAKAS
ncbi:MAG: nitrilase-related carbon-nitrogen hydrolase [Alphaproteobacteria bacterium]